MELVQVREIGMLQFTKTFEIICTNSLGKNHMQVSWASFGHIVCSKRMVYLNLSIKFLTYKHHISNEYKLW